MPGRGGDPQKINPLIPAELVIDHSVIAEAFGRPDACRVNADLEFDRNQERYQLLRWAQQAFDNFRVVPPDTGPKVWVPPKLTRAGRVAQHGRGVGMIQATASALMNQFANNLKKQLASPPAEGADTALPGAAKPISAASLAGQVVWSSIKDKLGGKS